MKSRSVYVHSPVRLTIFLAPIAMSPASIFDNCSTNPLIRLPPEIRNRIYGLVLPTENIFNVEFGSIYTYETAIQEGTGSLHFYASGRIYWPRLLALTNPSYSAGTPSQRTRLIALTQTCPTMRDESLRYFYGNNIFVLRVGDDLSDDCNGNRSNRNFRHWVCKRPSAAIGVLRLLIVPQWNCQHQKRVRTWSRDQDMGLIQLDFGTCTVQPLKNVNRATAQCEVCASEIASKLNTFKLVPARNGQEAARRLDDLWLHIRPREPWSRWAYRVVTRRLIWHFSWVYTFPLRLLFGACFVSEHIWNKNISETTLDQHCMRPLVRWTSSFLLLPLRWGISIACLLSDSKIYARKAMRWLRERKP